MNELMAYARLRANQLGCAVRVNRIRNFPIIDSAVVMIPIQMAGEAPTLFAVGVGDLRGNLRVLSCPSPTNRDLQYAMLADMVNMMRPFLDYWLANAAGAPQIICQSEAANILLLAVFDRMLFLDPDHQHSSTLRAAGRLLNFFNQRCEHPLTATFVAATTAVCDLFATGQDSYADKHLGALVEWLKPADGNIIARVISAESLPASTSTDPQADRDVLAPLVNAFYQAEQAGDAAAAQSARAEIDAFLTQEVTRRYELIMTAMQAVSSIAQSSCAEALANGDRAAFCRYAAALNGTPNISRRFTGSYSIMEYLNRESAHQTHEIDCMASAGRRRAEARIAGEVLAGQIVARRVERGRRKIVDIDLQTNQQRTPLRANQVLTLLDSATKFCFRVQSIMRTPQGLLVTLRMTAGMNSESQWPGRGDVVEFGPHQPYNTKTKYAWERLSNVSTCPVVSGPATTGHDYTSIIRNLEGNI